jgi:hypothetical protein
MDSFYEVTVSFAVPGEVERLLVTTLVDNFHVIENLYAEADKDDSQFVVEGYALKSVRHTLQAIAYIENLIPSKKEVPLTKAEKISLALGLIDNAAEGSYEIDEAINEAIGDETGTSSKWYSTSTDSAFSLITDPWVLESISYDNGNWDVVLKEQGGFYRSYGKCKTLPLAICEAVLYSGT